MTGSHFGKATFIDVADSFKITRDIQFAFIKHSTNSISGGIAAGCLSGWALFTAPGGGVPDGGTGATLLGAAFGALGVVRRFLMG
jgi:hypothetical protein